jgi:hypothetical protein
MLLVETKDALHESLAKIEAFSEALMNPLPNSSCLLLAREIKEEAESIRRNLERDPLAAFPCGMLPEDTV